MVKNRTFLFGSYSGLRQRKDDFSNTAVVPTAAERLGDFSVSRVKPNDPVTRLPFDGGIIPGYRALHALDYIGEPSLPAIISTARLTNSASRFLAIRSLWAHTNSAEVRTFLNEALTDPDHHVREDAVKQE